MFNFESGQVFSNTGVVTTAKLEGYITTFESLNSELEQGYSIKSMAILPDFSGYRSSNVCRIVDIHFGTHFSVIDEVRGHCNVSL